MPQLLKRLEALVTGLKNKNDDKKKENDLAYFPVIPGYYRSLPFFGYILFNQLF